MKPQIPNPKLQGNPNCQSHARNGTIVILSEAKDLKLFFAQSRKQ
jgi:hypothetical protein